MNRFYLTAGMLSLLPGLQAAAQSQQAQRPNIIYIMSDDHAYQAISAYGSEVSKLAPTPNIDRIAKAGVTFDRAFVENSLSTPSRACTLTGLYSHQNGQEQLNEGMDPTKPFVSELLQKCGYQTAVIGKWHVPCDPKGFDYYHIYNGQGEYYNPNFRGSDTGGKYVQEHGYCVDLVDKHAKEFLDNRDKSKPFFLMVHFKAPHRNQMPNLKYLGLFDDVKFPLLMAWKGHINPGTRCNAMVQNIDYAPTFLSLAGGKKTDEMSGLDLQQVWNGQTPKTWRTSIYYHYYDYPAFHQVRRHDGVRTDRYKLISFYGKGGTRAETNWYQTDPKAQEYRILHWLRSMNYTDDNDPDLKDCYELYDLQNDPDELHNIYGQPGTEKITNDLMKLLNKYRKDLKVQEY